MIRFTDNYRSEEHRVGPFLTGAVVTLGEAIDAQIVEQGKAVYVTTPSDDGTMPIDEAVAEPVVETEAEAETEAPEADQEPEPSPEPDEESEGEAPETETPDEETDEEPPEPATFTRAAAALAEERGLTAADFEAGRHVTLDDVRTFTSP